MILEKSLDNLKCKMNLINLINKNSLIIVLLLRSVKLSAVKYLGQSISNDN